jgi:hypothetical protein
MRPRPLWGQGWRKGGLLSELEGGGWIGTLPVKKKGFLTDYSRVRQLGGSRLIRCLFAVRVVCPFLDNFLGRPATPVVPALRG